MKILKTHYEKDIFPNREPSDVDFKDRITGKCIMVDSEGKIALVGTTVHYIYTLPGGGVDDSEKIEEGIKREVKEETGFDVEIIEMLGVIDDYRNREKKHCISYCAVANIIGEKSDINLTDSEKENGLHVKWLTPEDAISLLQEEYNKVKKGEIEYYNTAFNVVRDFEFLKKYCRGEEEKE
ncbi:MAG: NUDIX domain-containing protein [Patescibacteria group bacterium]|jgi:8-oxo-dGTP diphosphatase